MAAPLHEKADVIRQQLGLDDSVPLNEMVNKAIVDLGLEGEAKGTNLLQKVDMCLSALGVGPGGSGSSAAAVPIAPDVAASGW